jgi:ABC exporter DevB family membrane fusion protein
MKRTLIFSTIALLLAAVSLYYFFWMGSSKAERNSETPKIEAAKSNLIVAPGVVEAVSEEIEIGTEIAGKLRSVTVEEGDEVVKGQTIAVLENSDYEAQIRTVRANIETLQSARDTARARVGQAVAERMRIANGARNEERREARADFERTLPNVENARRELERRRKLYATGDVSREELERAANAFENAQKQSQTVKEKYNLVNADARADDLTRADAAIRLSEAQIREFDAQIKEAETRVRTAEANLEKTIVRAPISGVILRKRLKDGESVSPENPSGIVTIADISALRIRVDLDETDVAKIRENQTAYVTADAFGEQKFTARVVKIGKILGRKSFRTERPTERVDTKILEVLLELAPDQKLPLGLRVDAFISAAGEEKQ